MVTYICEKCDKLFTLKSSYNTHLKRKTPCDKLKPFIQSPLAQQCDICFKQFYSKRNLENHKKMKKPCSPPIISNFETLKKVDLFKSYTCEKCGYKTISKGDYTNHLNRKTPCDKPIIKLKKLKEDIVDNEDFKTKNVVEVVIEDIQKLKIQNDIKNDNHIDDEYKHQIFTNPIYRDELKEVKKYVKDESKDENINIIDDESKPFTNQITTSKTLNNINIDQLIKYYNKLLSIQELLIIINYNINNLYIDKFWNNIEDDSWIYLDEELIIWFGYKDIKNGKRKLLDFIKNSDNGEFSILNNEEYNKILVSAADTRIYVHQHQHIILSCDCFKEICFKIGTSKSKEIIKYFLELEKVFKFYNKYILAFNKNELLQSKLIHNRLINRTLLINNSILYLITNHQMAKENIFKFGKTDNEKARKYSYNTGHVEANKFFYVSIYDCYDASSLEKRIAKLLINFKIPNESEMYQLHFNALDYIIKELCKSEDKSIKKINSFIENDYDKYLNLEPIKFDKNIITEN